MTMRYSVHAVDRAGCSWEVSTTNDPEIALLLVNYERDSRGPRMATGWAYVIDDDSGEECSDRLEERCND
jgi:hypothetical protein